MKIDFLNCSEEKLAEYCFKFISVDRNDPLDDRRAMYYVIDQLQAMKKKTDNNLFSFPLSVLWKISGRCNSSCHHCWAALNDFSDNPRQIDVAKQLVENDVISVSISGGEPFMNSKIFDIISVLKKGNTIIEILSNGSLIDKETSKILANILNPNTDVIQISLDGSTQEIHDKQRNSPIFDRAIEGISNLKNVGLKVRNVFVSTPINQHDLFNTYKLSNSLGVDVFAPCPVFPLRKGKDISQKIDSIQYLRQISMCKAHEDAFVTKLRIQVDQHYQYLVNKYFNKNELLHNVDNKTYLVPMDETNSRMQFDAFGEAIPGPEWEKNMSAGNIYNENVKTIWERGINWQEFRNGRNLKNTKCASCKVFAICEGGNAKLAYDKYNTINMPDGTCMI